MSTLVIEGGRRIEGRVDVEGNKNAALPLMAACLLTDEWCTLHQRAAHRRRRGDGAAAARSRRRGRGHRQHDAAHPLRERHQGRARQHAGRPAARLGAAAGTAAGAPRPRRRSRRRAATFRRGAPSRRTSRRCGAMGACVLDGPGPPPRGAGRPEAGVDLPRRSVGHRHRDGAARRRRGAGRLRDSPRRLRAARRRAVRVPARAWASASPARARTRSASRASPSCGGATKTLYGDYIEAGSWAVVGAITGGDIEIRRHAAGRHGSGALGAHARWACTASSDGDVFRVEPSQLRRRRAASRPACGPDSRATW